MELRAHRQEGEKALNRCRIFTGNQKVYPYCGASHYGAVGRGAYQMETTVLCQLRFDPATMRGAAMEMRYDGMPLKISSLLSFISEFNAPRLSGPRCIESPYVAGGAPDPPPPPESPLEG